MLVGPGRPVRAVASRRESSVKPGRRSANGAVIWPARAYGRRGTRQVAA
jgi:hypothetical protein